MKVSVKSIRFVNEKYRSAGDPAPHGIDDLVERIGAQLGAVEDVEDYGAKYRGVIVARVVSCVDHPNADRLHVCLVDDGGVATDVERDDKGLVQVVCGAPNVREGLLVAWLPPGTVVPETFHHEAPFRLEARELRGVVSNGMLASAKELGLSDDHDGILEIDTDAQPGASFAAAYQLDDFIIDIENKMFTHRPDCFGSLGVAREIEGIYHRSYKSPEWYQLNPELPDAEAEPLQLVVNNEVSDIVPRFSTVVLRDVHVESSPAWLQSLLIRLGARPINNIVDYTNFFMLETGQPLHAYDYDKVATGTLGVRMGRENEKLNLLNGKQIEVTDNDVVITDGDKPIGLGGVMGGADTEVDENTKNIIIECANFDMYAIRRTSMRHGLFTDAVTRFNKGQSPLQTLTVLAKIVDEIREYTGGKVASDFVDDNHLPIEMRERGSVHPVVTTNREFINTRLGLDLSTDEIQQLLQNVEFRVDVQGEDLTILAPFWRTDIEIPEDIVEEVGRLYGYDRLPLELPRRDTTPAPRNKMLDLESLLRNTLARAGANEVLTYSFVHENLLNKVGQDSAQAFQISNALSPDLQYYRLSVLPSLLDKIRVNLKAGYDEFALFEMGKAHYLMNATDDEGLPSEFEMLDFVYAANDKMPQKGAAYYRARRSLQDIADTLHIEIEYRQATEIDHPLTKPFAIDRSAFVFVKNTDIMLGLVGELKASVRKGLKLPVHTAAFHLALPQLLQATQDAGNYYRPLSRFPSSSQDICLRVASETPYAKIHSLFETVLRDCPYQWRLTPLDAYQGSDGSTKQITIRVALTKADGTLTASDTQAVVTAIVDAAISELNAEYV